MPDQKGNPFIVARQMEDYRAREADYQNKFQLWQTSANTEIQGFRPKLQALIDQPATFKKTEIYECIKRSQLFLMEQDMDFPSSLPLYIFLISDCIHDASSESPFEHLGSNAKLIIANGSGSVGSISALNPLCFESVNAALSYVQDSQK